MIKTSDLFLYLFCHVAKNSYFCLVIGSHGVECELFNFLTLKYLKTIHDE